MKIILGKNLKRLLATVAVSALVLAAILVAIANGTFEVEVEAPEIPDVVIELDVATSTEATSTEQ